MINFAKRLTKIGCGSHRIRKGDVLVAKIIASVHGNKLVTNNKLICRLNAKSQ
jgi:hypothetical protein